MNTLTSQQAVISTEVPQLDLRSLKQIVTHDGIFHADEVRACALILLAKAGGCFSRIFVHQQDPKGKIIVTVSDRANGSKIEIIRDRSYTPAYDDFVIDTGGVHDGPKWRFDHHQKSFVGKWRDGTPMASAGLVFHAYMHVFKNDFTQDAWMKIYDMTKGIDARDNGILSKVYTTSQCIASFIPPWGEFAETTKEEMNNAFAKALRWDLEYIKDSLYHDSEKIVADMGEIINNMGGHRASEIRAEQMISERVSNLLSGAPHAPILELDRFIPWAKGKTIKESPKSLKFVVYPSYNKGEYCCQTISDYEKTEEGSALKSRCPFPSLWSGLSGEILQKVSGIQTAKFCHKNLFLFVATDKIGAVEAAIAGIEEQDTEACGI